MADNTTLAAASGGDVVRDKDRSGVKTQIVALDLNPAGSETLMAGGMPVTGVLQTAATGTITSSASVVGGATDYGTAGNITVTFDGTYAGVNATFEVSDDGGTTWYATQGQRIDAGIAESATGVLAANTLRAWNFSMLGYNRFRVRATAYTSGTANVNIAPGTFPFVPVVSALMSPLPKTLFGAVTTEAGIAPTASSALQTLQVSRAGGAASGLTSVAITAGKTLRIQSMTLTVSASTTTAVRGVANIRYNPTGATTTSTPAVAEVGAASPAAVAASTGFATMDFADGLDLVGGTAATFGVSLIGSSATGLAWVSITGYEF